MTCDWQIKRCLVSCVSVSLSVENCYIQRRHQVSPLSFSLDISLSNRAQCLCLLYIIIVVVSLLQAQVVTRPRERKVGVVSGSPQPLQTTQMMLQHHGTSLHTPSWLHIGPRPDLSMLLDHLLCEHARNVWDKCSTFALPSLP